MISLLDLITKEQMLNKKIASTKDSLEKQVLVIEAEKTRKAIEAWGRQENTVYRIC